MPGDDAPRSRLLDPLEYDAMFGHTWSGRDVSMWKRLAERHGGPGLELGSGTGRLTLRLAEAGIAMAGVDREPAMLEHARRKSRRCGLDVRWHLADATAFDLGERFEFALFPFNGVAQLLDETALRQCFGCVRRHVVEGGIFGLDVMNPQLARADFALPQHWASYPGVDRGSTVAVTFTVRYDPETRIGDHRFVFVEPGRPSFEESLELRSWDADELGDALGSVGFEVEAVWGDYDETPYEDRSPALIVIARANR